jgi:hypothetical protein
MLSHQAASPHLSPQNSRPGLVRSEAVKGRVSMLRRRQPPLEASCMNGNSLTQKKLMLQPCLYLFLRFSRKSLLNTLRLAGSRTLKTSAGHKIFRQTLSSLLHRPFSLAQKYRSQFPVSGYTFLGSGGRRPKAVLVFAS